MIVPALTFVATVNPVMYVGARPVFADVNINTWNIDPSAIEKNITPKTRAIIPVHLYGNPCEMDKIMEIAKKHGLFVIEDATESLGAQYAGRYTGTYGDYGCFSFNGNKTITTGGGGMIVGNDPEGMDHLKFLVNQARDETRGYFHPEVGFNYRMTNLEASMGLAQMERLEELSNKKERIHAIYQEELAGESCIDLQLEYEGGVSSWWFNCIYFTDGMDLADVMRRLKNEGIPTRRVFMPINQFPPYERCGSGDLENSQKIYERGLCLPSSTLNREEDIGFACRKIKELIAIG